MQTKSLSAPVIRQIEPPTTTNYNYAVGTSYLYQDFFLPSDYERGPETSEARLPPLTGFSLFVGIDSGQALRASLDYQLEHQDLSTGLWDVLTSGTTIGCHADGNEVWFDIYFNQPVELVADWYNERHRFRFSFKGRNPASAILDQPVEYDGQFVNINGELIEARLRVGETVPIIAAGDPAFVRQDPSGQVYYSTQGGVNKIWYTAPNPLATQFAKATTDGTTAIQDAGRDVSFLFHVSGAVGDQGIDWLGNSYRYALAKKAVGTITTLDPTVENSFWLSKPNPSKFAVESLYFDLTDDGEGQVIDRIFLNPVTPGVFFNVYYSNEGERPTNEFEWENKLWTRMKQNFQMKRRETHALAQPITARYMKLEFTHLQAKPYSPGAFQKPLLYKKHPKWVLDYFLLRAATDLHSEDPYTARQVDVTFDAFDIAFNYYLDDLHQEPLNPVQLGFDADSSLNHFLQDRTDQSDVLDTRLLTQVSTVLQPFTQNPVVKDSILQSLPLISLANDPRNSNSSLEGLPPASNLSGDVASINKNSIVFEQTYPVMFFWLDCRHRYRELKATFDHDRGYFAGVREIAFMRDHYDVAHDSPLYIEGTGDLVNVDRSDFATVDFGWQTYDPSRSDIPIF